MRAAAVTSSPAPDDRRPPPEGVWVTVDIIYVPLYLSRGLELTSRLYGVFLAMALFGLIRLRHELEAAE